MKKLFFLLTFISFLLFFPACSEDDSPNETENQTESDVDGDWGVNYESYTGASLVQKLSVYITIDSEVNGVISGSGTIDYENHGTYTTTLSVEDDVTGYYYEDQSPNIYVTITSASSTLPPFTFSGSWDTFGENFTGTVTIYSGTQQYTLTDQSFYARGN